VPAFRSSTAWWLAVVSLALSGTGCGGSGSPSSPSPSPTPDNTFRITISAAGAVSPAELVVPPGTRVLFVNNHSQQHEMTSDPHPEHSDCPAINSVGLLRAGDNRETGNLVAVRTCGFHDHANPTNASLQGRIIVR
jgi:plastocyanin